MYVTRLLFNRLRCHHARNVHRSNRPVVTDSDQFNNGSINSDALRLAGTWCNYSDVLLQLDLCHFEKWSVVPLSFLSPVYEPKSTVHLLTLAFNITNQKSNSQPLHSAHPFHCTYVMYVVCFDFYCFYVLFHLHLLSGRRAASLLLNWLIDWL